MITCLRVSASASASSRADVRSFRRSEYVYDRRVPVAAPAETALMRVAVLASITRNTCR
jgi:hypothetical protein